MLSLYKQAVKMEFFQTCNGIPVHISDSGKGSKVFLFLHGYLESLYIWDDLIKYLPKDIRAISLDVPGHGLSGTDKNINSMSFCADVLKDLLIKLEIKERVVVVGHSMGGYIALEAIKRYPDLFDALVLMHSAPFADNEEKKNDRDREIGLIQQNKLMQIVKLAIPKMFAPGNLARLEDKIIEIEETAQIHDHEGIIASIKGMKMREDYCNVLASSPIPVILFQGRYDNYMPVERIEEIAGLFPAMHIIIMENSGHASFIEEPELAAEKLQKIDWLYNV